MSENLLSKKALEPVTRLGLWLGGSGGGSKERGVCSRLGLPGSGQLYDGVFQ